MLYVEQIQNLTSYTKQNEVAQWQKALINKDFVHVVFVNSGFYLQ